MFILLYEWGECKHLQQWCYFSSLNRFGSSYYTNYSSFKWLPQGNVLVLLPVSTGTVIQATNSRLSFVVSPLSSCCPDVWQCLADLCNVLARVDHGEVPLYKVDTEESEGDEELTVLQLKEDRLLAGFIPLLAAPQEPCYTDRHTDMVSGKLSIASNARFYMQSSLLCLQTLKLSSCSLRQ